MNCGSSEGKKKSKTCLNDVIASVSKPKISHSQYQVCYKCKVCYNAGGHYISKRWQILNVMDVLAYK